MLLGVSNKIWVIIIMCIIIALLDFVIKNRENMRNNADNKSALTQWGAVFMCLLIAVAATVLSKLQRYVGAPMIALLIGIVIVNVIPNNKAVKDVTSFIGKRYLNFGIVMLGATLSFTNLFNAVSALPLIVFNTALSFSVAYLVGKKCFGVSDNTCTLVGSGTCVCGGTAIASISPIIKAKEEETAYALTAIFLFDLLACLSYPYLAIKFNLSDVQFGFLAGTAINDTSSVVAAQETYASLKGLKDYSVPATIKVVRTSMIIILTIIFSVITMKKEVKESSDAQVSLGGRVWKALPKFLLFFAGAVLINTFLSELISGTVFYKEYFKPFFGTGYKFFVTLALAGVGFKIKFKELFTKGLKPIALGGCTWIAVFISSLTFSLFFAEKVF